MTVRSSRRRRLWCVEIERFFFLASFIHIGESTYSPSPESLSLILWSIMGSGGIVTSGGGGGWCRWRWLNSNNGTKNSTIKNGNNNYGPCFLSSTFAYFLLAFAFLGSIGCLYAKFMLTANWLTGITTMGCLSDNEGSWAIGVFYGDSPFNLKPIEDVSSLIFHLYVRMCTF